MPKVFREKQPKQPLQVVTDMWGASSSFVDRQGKRRKIANYQEARDYAEANGYSGIRIKYK